MLHAPGLSLQDSAWFAVPQAGNPCEGSVCGTLWLLFVGFVPLSSFFIRSFFCLFASNRSEGKDRNTKERKGKACKNKKMITRNKKCFFLTIVFGSYLPATLVASLREGRI